MSEYKDMIVPPRTTMIINGKLRGAGFKYKIRVNKPKQIEPTKGGADELQ